MIVLAAVPLLIVLLVVPSRGDAVERRPPQCNLAGNWQGTGVDVRHTRWTFTLALTQRGTALDGRFVWRSNLGHNGEERVRGSVNCAAKRIHLQGLSVTPGAHLATARYTLSTSAWFNAIWGNWSGPGIPGSLRGRKIAPSRPR